VIAIRDLYCFHGPSKKDFSFYDMILQSLSKLKRNNEKIF